MIERQSRNVEWAIIDKGPFQLHPSLNHFVLPAEVWLSMSVNDKESYIKKVMSSSVTDTVALACSPTEEMAECVSTDPSREDFPRVSIDQERCLSPLDVLADAALSSSVQDTTGPRVSNMSLPFSEFRVYLHGQPQETVKGMWDKAVELVSSPGKISSAPGCDPTSKMVASHRFKDRPHLVTKGKANGENRCEKNCPHWNGIKICSHTIATAESNGDLSKFLVWYKEKRSTKAANLSAVVRTDMPQYPGRKGGVPATLRRATPKLPVDARRKRTYSKSTESSVPSTADIPNTNPFYVKKMNARIKVCQGCRGPLKSAGGNIQPPPFDYCVARRERRQYRDDNGQLKTPSRPSDAHYHLRAACVKAAEPSFVTSSLVIPDDMQLTEVHECYLIHEFGLSFVSN